MKNLICTVLCFLAFQVNAEIELDQINDDINCPPSCSALNAAYVGHIWEQSVTTGLDGKLMSIDLHFEAEPGYSGNFWVNVGVPFQGDANDFETIIAVNDGWNSIDVSSANIYLASGDMFVFGYQGQLTDGSLDPVTISATDGQYGGGSLYLDQEIHIPGFDMNFRTYVDVLASVEIDIVGGGVQECSQTNGALVSAIANITIDPDDAVSGITWLLDGVSAGNGTEFNQFVTLGTHQIEVNVTTVNGETAADIATVTVEDTQPPIVIAQFINRLTGEPIDTLQLSRNLIEINAEANDVCDTSAAVIDVIYGNTASDGNAFLAIGYNGGFLMSQNQLVLKVDAQDTSGNRASAFSVLSAP